MKFTVNLALETGQRFDPAKFIEWDSLAGSYDILSSPFMERVRNLPAEGVYTVSTEVGRMELVAFKIYGSTQYWYLLMEYNRLVGHESVVPGMQLRYPRQEDLERVYFELKSP